MEKSFHITTFGCQMNEHDSEIMAGLLSEIGYEEKSERKDANIEIINTCSVRDNADKRFFGTLGQLKKRKENDPDFIVGVCGCMMQQEHVTDQIKAKYPWVDLIFGTHNIHRLPDLLNNVIANKDKEMEVLEDRKEIVENLPAKRLFKDKALVNITFGCNNFCTYCIVPYTRGREKSRCPEEVINEIKRLACDGVKEVMLLGQNVNSYKGAYENPETRETAKFADFDEEYCTFAHLIRLIAEVPGIERIRFMTSHPKDLSPELIKTFASCDKLCKSIHLPVQSGSDRILKRMNRHYDREKYLSTVEALREAVPDITISTDIIVGFPGETDKDFEDTLDIVRRVRYDSAFTFIYSKRNGTPAASYEDQVPEDLVHERFEKLVDAVNEISAEKNALYEGKIERVLVEGSSKRNAKNLSGRTDGFKLVNFPGDKSLVGKFIDVEITKGKTFSLEGIVVNSEE